VLRMSRTAGNRAVAQLIAGRASSSRMSAVRIQRKYVLPDDQKVATGRLQEAFPGITIEGSLDEKDDRFWETYMKEQLTPVTLEQFVRSLLLKFLPAAVRTGVKVTLSSEGALPASDGGQTDLMGKGIRVVVDTTQPLDTTKPLSDANQTFHLTQVYTAVDGRVSIHIENVFAVGRGPEFVTSSLLSQASLLNARWITLQASGFGGRQDGVFAWVRYGFLPPQEDWNSMRGWGLERLERLPVDLRASIAKALLDPSPKALRWIIYVYWGRKDAVKAWLNGMVSSQLAWDGAIDLDDPISREWIVRYARRVDDPAQYKELLPKLVEEGVRPPDVEAPVEEPEPVLSEKQMKALVALCVAAINSDEATIADVQTEYAAEYPGIVEMVQNHPDLKGKAEVR